MHTAPATGPYQAPVGAQRQAMTANMSALACTHIDYVPRPQGIMHKHRVLHRS
jgi:hypothetical protein